MMRNTLLLTCALWLATAASAFAREGEFDPTFGNYLPGRSLAGSVPAGAFSHDSAFTVLVMPDRTLFVAGTSSGVGLLVRFLPNGALDPVFGSGGLTTILPPGAADFSISAAAQLADGRILLGGSSEYESIDFVVCRIHPAGTLDSSFGSGGCTHYDFGQLGNGNDNDFAESIAVDLQGRILLAGTASAGRMAVVRFSSGGVLDTGFGANGRAVITRFEETGEPVARTNGVSVQVSGSNGSILLAGTVVSSSSPFSDFGVARLDANGVLDPGFSGDGVVRIDFNPAAPRNDYASDSVLQPDGRLVIVGYTTISASDSDFAIARLTAQGELDATFAGDGRQVVPFFPSASGHDLATGVLLQPDSRIVVAGYAGNPADGGVGGHDLAVLRLLSNGGPDFDFGNSTAGRFTGSYNLGGGGSNHDRLYALALQGSKVIAVGEALLGSERDLIAIRLTDAALFQNGFE